MGIRQEITERMELLSKVQPYQNRLLPRVEFSPMAKALLDSLVAPDVNPKGIEGRKKPQMHAVPMGPMFEVGAIMLGAGGEHGGGAQEYGFFNWRETPITMSDYTNAIYRHFEAILRGEDIDPKSGRPHLAHIIGTALILMDAKDHGTLVDDRWKPAA